MVGRDVHQPSLKSPSPRRILICGRFSSGTIEGDLLLHGFLQLFKNHEHLREFSPLVVSANPERTSSLHDVETIDDNLEAIIQALAGGCPLLSVGETFADNDQQTAELTTRMLQRSLAGIVTGRPTGVIGAGIGPFKAPDTAAVLCDIFGRLDLLTVRDQASAILLARSGLTSPAMTTADFAFGLPTEGTSHCPTGKLGIDAGGMTSLDDTHLADIASAVNHLSTQMGLRPVIFADDSAEENRAIGYLRDHVPEADLCRMYGTIPQVLEELRKIDVLLATQYRSIIAAAAVGIPAIALCFDPALNSLAQQLRLGNFALSPERMAVSTIVRVTQQLLNNQDRICRSLQAAYLSRRQRAVDNFDHVARMLAEIPNLRVAEINPEDFISQAKTLVTEVIQVRDKSITEHRQPSPGNIPGIAAGGIPHRALPPEPLVTIYICAYNAGRWIEQAVSSAMKQTYANLEILVVDDGSTDNTVARVRKFADQRIVVHQIKHGGIARARTHAKQHFRGDLIVCLDADDWLAPELIAKQVSFLQKNPEVDVTYCDRMLVDEQGNLTGDMWHYLDYPEPRRLLGDMFTGGRGRIPNGSMMERAEIAKATGGYNPAFVTTEDFDYAARLATVARSFRGIGEPLYFYRSFMSGASGNWDIRNKAVTAVWREMWERHGGEFLLGDEPGRGLTGKRKEAAYLCRAADIACRHGEAYIISGASRHFFEFACEFYVKALALEPYNYTAGTQVMKLAAAGHLHLKSDVGTRADQIVPHVDAFYPNQPMLDVLFEQAIPELLENGRTIIDISVFQAGSGCEPYTIVIETLRRGLPLEKLRIRAFDSRPDKLEKAARRRYTHDELFDRGRNHLTPALAERYFTKLSDGQYSLNDDVTAHVSFMQGDITSPGSISPESIGDAVLATSIWEPLDYEAAKSTLNNLIGLTRADGYLILGGYYPSRDVALAEHRNLEPVRERFEDIHNGWRSRRGAYGVRPFGLEPLDRRYPEWPWRYGCIFRKREPRQLDLGSPNLLKTYWTERGKIYQKQYPAKPLEELPVPHRIVRALIDERPESVLDYGCGFGTVLREVRRALPQARLTGLDISRNVLFDGYKYLLGEKPIGLVESDGKTIPFPDDSFDTTFTHVTLIHVPHEEIRGVLREMLRVTRKTLYIGESAYKEHEQFYYFAHDYQALFAEMGLRAEELNIPNAEKQPGTRLFRVKITGKPASGKNNGRPHKRLLVVSDRRSVHTHRFCRYFRDQGHEVHLFDAGTDWRGLEGIVQHAPDPVRFPESDADRLMYARVARLREIITAIKPDFVHAHYLHGWGWWAAMAAGDTPLALTAWGSDVFLLPQEKSHARNMTRWALQLADYRTADSATLARETEKLAGNGCPVALVPVGIDITAFRPGLDTAKLRQRLMIPEQARVILSPRQIKPGANIQFIIDAFSSVADDEPRALLVLKTYLTTFETQSEFMKLIRTKLTEMNLWDRVRIVHDLPAAMVPALYNLAEVTVSVRDTDGTPCTLFESAAAGTPFIAGDIPSLAEWITDNENGLLVPTRNSAAIARAIKHVFTGGPEIDKIKANAREFALANGDYRRCFSRIEEMYCRPLSREPKGKAAPVRGELDDTRRKMCAAIDKGNFEQGFQQFQTLNRLVAEADFIEVYHESRKTIAQPVR